MGKPVIRNSWKKPKNLLTCSTNFLHFKGMIIKICLSETLASLLGWLYREKILYVVISVAERGNISVLGW
ncbi:MAG: hypothetical protein LBV19_07680 [Streptococcaceae bacterium]|nr:hypothetical protein [Streptococcaceae bacterium]